MRDPRNYWTIKSTCIILMLAAHVVGVAIKTQTRMSKKKPDKQKSGPKPDTIKIDGDWEDSVGKALKKKRPKEGWPKAK